MIAVYIVVFAALAIGSILFFPIYATITSIINNVPIPASMNTGWINFILAYRNWYLFLFIVGPLLLYVFVQSQKPDGRRYRV